MKTLVAIFFFLFAGIAWLSVSFAVRPNVQSRVAWVAAGLGVLVFGVLLATYVMVSAMCTSDFPMHLFEDGLCAATDTPFDVAVAFGFVFAVVAGILFLVALAAEIARRRWPR